MKLLHKIRAYFRKSKPIETIKQNPEVRKKILDFEEELRQLPGALIGDDVAPLKHTFVDGAYIRQMTVSKGTLLTTKIHKKEHPYFMMQGDVSILTEEGVVRIKAPHHGITKPGTKRVVYIHEDTVWITVHVTNSNNLKKIEEEVIAKTYDDIPSITSEQLAQLKGA